MGDEQGGLKWTEAGLRALAPTGRREQFSDPRTPGLVLLMTPAGAKTFYLVYRVGGGRTGTKRWFKLGRFGVDLGLGAAREAALRKRGEVAAGGDPQGERKAGRVVGLTVADLCDRFERDYLDAGKVAASTAVFYRKIIAGKIRPALGRRALAEVAPADVAGLLKAVAPGQVRKVAATLSRMFNRAELWGLREQGTNPVRGQDLPSHQHRDQRLTPDQVRALGEALRALELPWQGRALFTLLLLTGMRGSELAGNPSLGIPARLWADLSIEEGVLRLPRHKTVKRAGVRVVYLCTAARTILEALPREGELILGGWGNARAWWPKVRAEAKLEGLTIHDLRHTFSSVGDDLGFSEATRAALLGHAAATQTARYTHKLSRDLAAAAEAIGGHLAGLLGIQA